MKNIFLFLVLSLNVTSVIVDQNLVLGKEYGKDYSDYCGVDNN